MGCRDHVRPRIKAAGEGVAQQTTTNALWMRQYLRPLLTLLSAALAVAYEAPFSDSDYSRQVCSGMWGGPETYINGARQRYIPDDRHKHSVWYQSRSMLAHLMAR